MGRSSHTEFNEYSFEQQRRKALLARYTYPRVWSKYRQFKSESVFEMRHQVILDGGEWERVLTAALEKATEAFREDVAAMLHLSVDAVKPPMNTGAFQVELIVKHAAKRVCGYHQSRTGGVQIRAHLARVGDSHRRQLL
ncbi:46 kD virulence factor [Leishmania guyanensis]